MTRGRKNDPTCHATMKMARELGYGEDVIQNLKFARSDSEISRIMRDARRREEDGKDRNGGKKYFTYVEKK